MSEAVVSSSSAGVQKLALEDETLVESVTLVPKLSAWARAGVLKKHHFNDFNFITSLYLLYLSKMTGGQMTKSQ